jgi:CheY-like chemotaxis protein
MSNTHGVILIVEDEEDDVYLIRHAFEQVGIRNPLHIAENCREAIAYLAGTGKFAERAKFPLPVLVLLDLMLPDKSGVEVLRKIQELKIRPLCVIAFTSATDLTHIRAAYQAGATSYVAKPTNDQDRQRLAMIIKEYWLGYNLFPPR